MNKKYDLLKFAGICCFLLICSLSASAQNTSGSPYSMYGMGLLKDNTGAYTSMGGVSAGMRDNNNINLLNPASYTALDSNRFYFQFGIDGEYVNISTHQERSDYRVAQNATLNMALRLFRNMHASFGFNQRANIGYDLYYHKPISGSTNEFYTQIVSGSGGINDAYFGLAYKFGNFSLGVNTSFLFGNIEKRLSLMPIVSGDLYYMINTQNRTSVQSALFDIGLQQTLNLSALSKLTIGATFSLPTNLNAKRHFISYKVNPTTGIQEILNDEELNNGRIAYPFRVTGGFSYNHKDRWTVAADYTFHQMSKYKEFGETQEFNDYHKGALGLSFLPARLGRYWWQRNSYNIGLYAAQTQIQINNHPVNVLGATVGAQFPVRVSTKELVLGVAFDLGIRGTEQNGLIREQYAKVKLNVAFKESWFVKRKIH
jgi:hypothetical protein